LEATIKIIGSLLYVDCPEGKSFCIKLIIACLIQAYLKESNDAPH